MMIFIESACGCEARSMALTASSSEKRLRDELCEIEAVAVALEDEPVDISLNATDEL